MAACIYPGSFDPPTFGHMDMIRRLASLYERVVVCVMLNPAKAGLFTSQERVGLLEEACESLPNVRVRQGEGFTVFVAREEGATAMARGLRSVLDFEYESQLAKANRYLAPEVETVFLLSSAAFDGISSSMVREIASLGGDVSAFVPPCVAEALRIKWKASQKEYGANE